MSLTFETLKNVKLVKKNFKSRVCIKSIFLYQMKADFFLFIFQKYCNEDNFDKNRNKVGGGGYWGNLKLVDTHVRWCPVCMMVQFFCRKFSRFVHSSPKKNLKQTIFGFFNLVVGWIKKTHKTIARCFGETIHFKHTNHKHLFGVEIQWESPNTEVLFFFG